MSETFFIYLYNVYQLGFVNKVLCFILSDKTSLMNEDNVVQNDVFQKNY